MFTGESVRLRPIEREDLDNYVEWFNDPALRARLLARLPVSRDEEVRWYEGLLKNANSKVFAIDIEEADNAPGARWQHAGSCGLEEISLLDGRASAGIFIGPERLRHRGFGTEAMRLLLALAFDELRLHRVELEVFSDNPAAIKSYEKLGFQREGLLRGKHFRAGTHKDIVVMSILQPEWVDSKV